MAMWWLETAGDTSEDQTAAGKRAVSASEVELQKLDQEIKDLHSDVGDEVSNYMRSKQEIKAMKQRLSSRCKVKQRSFALL